MPYKKNYNYPSEYTENDDIYDEETDYYTQDSDLARNKSPHTKISFKNFHQYNDN